MINKLKLFFTKYSFNLNSILLTLTLFIFLTLTLYLFFIRPELKKSENLEKELNNLQYKLNFQQNFIPFYEQLNARLNKLDKEIISIKFKKVKLINFKNILQKECAKYNLNLIYLKPEFNLSQKNSIKIDIALRGKFKDFIYFMENFLTLGYFKKIDEIILTQNLDSLNIQFKSEIEVIS